MTPTRPKARITLSHLITWLHGISPRSLWIALGLLAAGLIFTTFASLYIKAEVESAAQREFDFICNEIQLNIADRLAANAQVLRSGAALFDSSDTVTREEWRIFSQKLQIDQHLPGTQGIGFSQLIPREQLTQHIEEIRREGFPDYQINPAGERNIYSSIIYLEPFAGRNLRAFGYDMFSEPVRRAAMELARDENIAALSGKVTLVQETDEDVQAGALMYVPIYRHDMPIDTVEQRRAAIMGWVYSPYRMNDLMRGTLRGWDVKQQDRRIFLQVYDGDLLSEDTLLYDSQSVEEREVVAPNSGALTTRLIPVDFAGRHWTLKITQLGGLASVADYDSVRLVALGGTIISLLLFGLTLSLLSTRASAQRIAEDLTAELRRWAHIFEAAEWGITVVSADGKTLELLNPAFARMHGFVIEELKGKPLLTVFAPEVRAEVPANINMAHEKGHHIWESSHVRKDGSRFPVLIDVTAVCDEYGKISYHIVNVQDITERKQIETELRDNRKFLADLIEYSATIVFAKDKEGRYELVNHKYEEVTGIPREAIIGHTDAEIFPAEIFVRHQASDLQVLESGQALEMEDFIDKPAGKQYLFTIKFPLRGDDGGFRGVCGISTDITERKQAEERLRASEARYRYLFEQVHDAVFILDLNGHHLAANQRAADMLGYQMDEILKMSVKDTSAEMNQSVSVISSLLAGEHIPLYEHLFRKKDGQIIHAEVNVELVRDERGEPLHIQSVVRDITERKQVEDALRESEEKFRSLIEQSIDGIILIDEQGRIIEWNSAETRVTGIPKDRAMGAPFWEIQYQVLKPESRAKISPEYLKKTFIELFQSDQTEQPQKPMGVEIISLTGEHKFIQQTSFVIKTARGNRVAAIVNDITERKQAEEEVKRLNASLEQRVEERTQELRDTQEKLIRQERLAVLGQMAGSVGHELRNPLGVMSNAIYFLKLIQSDASAKVKEYLDLIEKNIHISDKIVGDLLDFTRIKSLDREAISIPQVVRQTLERFPAPESVRVEIDVPAALPQVYADPQHVIQILGNLTANACQAMPQGGQIFISCHTQDEIVCITVQDTGTGISPENMKKLFEPLFTTKPKGIGLGLAVCKKLAEANGGRIEVESQAGLGSAFTLYLPFYLSN